MFTFRRSAFLAVAMVSSAAGQAVPATCQGASFTVNVPQGTVLSTEQFKDCTTLTAVTFQGGGAGNTQVGIGAFDGCTNLVTVTFDSGSSVSEIGNRAFQSTALTTIDMTNVQDTVLGATVFSSCTSLATITLPPGVTELGTHFAFGCTSLATLNNADSLVTIGVNAFQNSALASFTIPNTLTTLGSGAFRGSSNLATVTFEATSILTDIPFNAFRETGLTAIAIPSSVTSIGNNAFQTSASLKEVTMPGVTSIGVDAFRDCVTLDTISIPNSITIGSNAFVNTACDASIFVAGAEFAGCSVSPTQSPTQSPTSSPTPTCQLNNFEVTFPRGSVVDTRYAGCLTLTKVTFEGDAGSSASTTVAIRAFEGCANLAVMDMQADSGVTDLGNRAFSQTGLSNADLSNFAGTSLGAALFENSANLGTITLPAAVTALDTNFAFGCAALTTVNLNGATLATIGVNAFQGCNLVAFTLQNTLTSVGSGAFRGNANLATVTFEATSQLTEIAFNTFRETGLTTIAIPASVTAIGNDAFHDCTSLNGVTMPGVTTIGDNAFEGCTSLDTISIPAGVTLNVVNSFFQAACTPISVYAPGAELAGCSESPTQSPTASPTASPTQSPTTSSPTASPTSSPTTSAPTTSPTSSPTTSAPTASPTSSPTTSSPTASPSASPTASPTQSPTQSPTVSPTASPTTPCSTLGLTFTIDEGPATCSLSGKGKKKGSSVDNCYADGLGDAVKDAFAAFAAANFNLPAPVNGVAITLEDILDSVEITGADGVSSTARTGVTVDLTFKPESPLIQSEFAAAAAAWRPSNMAITFCGCTSTFSVTDSSSQYNFAVVSLGKSGKSPKCNGAFSVPKAGKKKKTAKTKTGKGKKVTSVGATTSTSATSGTIVGAVVATVVAVTLVAIVIKRKLRTSTFVEEEVQYPTRTSAVVNPVYDVVHDESGHF